MFGGTFENHTELRRATSCRIQPNVLPVLKYKDCQDKIPSLAEYMT